VTELALVASRFRQRIGRHLTAITESRHWFQGHRQGDAQSLVHAWLHFEANPPLWLHSCGEVVEIAEQEPGDSFDMDEYGEIRIAPTKAPDLLASVVGRRLTGVDIYQGYTAQPQCGGFVLNFDSVGHLMLG